MGTTTRSAGKPKTLTLQAASAEYGPTIGILRDLIANGDLPVIRLPHIRRLYLSREVLEARLAAWTEVAR